MENTFYIPIRSENLAHYVAGALICPVAFLKERNSDVQSQFSDFVLLSKKQYTENSNCSIEIVITEEEKKYLLTFSENCVLLEQFLPISRVRKIFFQKQEQADRTVWNINEGRGFIPERLIAIEEGNSNNTLLSDELNNKCLPSNGVDNQTLIDRYNRLLGGFALMRIGGEKYMNYSTNYFRTLSNINKTIELELEKAGKITDIKTEDKYDWLILNNKPTFSDLYTITYSSLAGTFFKEYADENKISYEFKLGKIQLDSIDNKSKHYLIAVISSYGELGFRSTLDNFVSDLMNNRFPAERKEGLSLMFGINKGYNAFRNFYKTPSFYVDVKFRLENNIDYYIIESIYQFVVNNRNSTDFHYLESFMPINRIKADKSKYKIYSILQNDIIYALREPTLRDKIGSFIRNHFFREVKKSFFKSYERKLGFQLTAEQKEITEKEWDHIFSDSLSICGDKLTEQISSLYAAKEAEQKNEIERLKVGKKELSQQLRNLDPELFDWIDKDKDLLLSTSQTVDFVERLIKKQSVEKPVIEKEKPKPYKVEPVESPSLFSVQESNDLELYSKNSSAKRKEELNAYSFTELKKIAKKHSISPLKKYKDIPFDRIQLIDLIIEKEGY